MICRGKHIQHILELCHWVSELLIFFFLDSKKSHFSISLSVPHFLSLFLPLSLSQVKEVVADSRVISVFGTPKLCSQQGSLKWCPWIPLHLRGGSGTPTCACPRISEEIQEHLCLRRVATRGLPQQAVWTGNWVAEAASFVCTPGVDSFCSEAGLLPAASEPAALLPHLGLPAHFFGGNALFLCVCH